MELPPDADPSRSTPDLRGLNALCLFFSDLPSPVECMSFVFFAVAAGVFITAGAPPMTLAPTEVRVRFIRLSLPYDAFRVWWKGGDSLHCQDLASLVRVENAAARMPFLSVIPLPPPCQRHQRAVDLVLSKHVA